MFFKGLNKIEGITMTLLHFMRRWSRYDIKLTITSENMSATLQAFHDPQMSATVKIDTDVLIDFEVMYGHLDDALDSMVAQVALKSVRAIEES